MFVPLRVHSVYSKRKGGATLQELASWACRRRVSPAALTDIGNLYGWGGWKRFAQDSDFAPLFGCEAEVQGKRFLFLVKSREGYWNLMETLNQKEIGKTEGLIVVFIPQPGEEGLPEGFDFSRERIFILGVIFLT